MMNFPDNPTPGQVFNPGTGPLYQYDGVAWNLYPVQVKTADARNRIVNPGMRISQEAGQAAIASGYLADQWNMVGNGLTLQGANQSIWTPARSPNLILHSYQVAKASLAAGDYGQIYQPIEGIRTADFAWGTADAIPAVLRFSLKSETVGTYTVTINDSGGSYTFLAPAVIDAVNVWKTFTVPVPPPSGGTWLTTNSASLFVHFCTAAGSTYGGGVAGWQSGNKLALAAQVNMAATANKNIFIGDVGLYADPYNTGIAPPFELPDFVEDLLECQRYFEMVGMTLVTSANGGNPFDNTAFFKATKRTAPTLAASAGALNGATGQVIGFQPQAGIRQTGFATTAVDVQWSCFARM